MQFIIRVLLLATITMLGNAQAMLPESGWWWNPNQSGSGFNIEIQDNVLFVSTFTYDDSGNPAWYSAAGEMTGDRSFSGNLLRTSGGACLACNYRSPNKNVAAGSISIAFSSPTQARVTINGSRVVDIERFNFALGTTSSDSMQGEWAIVEGSVAYPVYFGERVEFDSKYRSSDGTVSATGQRTGDSQRIAMATYYGNGEWAMIIDTSSGYYSFYMFSFHGFNAIEGRSWTYAKSSSLSGSGLPFIAFRSPERVKIVVARLMRSGALRSQHRSGRG